MTPVEIIPMQGALVLRARGAELLILPAYVAELKQLKNTKDFAQFFMQQALINRPARKLYEAWLRKDKSLWQRIYKTVGEMEIDEAALEATSTEDTKPAEEVASESKTPDSVDTAAASDEAPKKATAKKKETVASDDDDETAAKKATSKKSSDQTSAKKTAAKKKTVKKASSSKADSKEESKKKSTKTAKKTSASKAKTASASKKKTSTAAKKTSKASATKKASKTKKKS